MLFKYLILLYSLIFIYYPRTDEFHNIGIIEAIGISGSHVLLFFIIFIISKIYSYHIERVIFDNKMNSQKVTFESIITLLLCFLLPVYFISATGFYSLNINDITLVDGFLLVIVSYLLFDMDRSLRLSIVVDYEKRIERWGHRNGVFFTGYPPKNKDDITYSIVIIIVIVSVVVFIGTIR